jgi:hypothetical protein
MKFMTATVFGLMLSSRIFGAVADEFRCELKITDESTQVMVGSMAFEASPVRKMAIELPPTTTSNIYVRYTNEKIDLHAHLGFTFQMGSGVEKATFARTSSISVCGRSQPSTCRNIGRGDGLKDGVLIVNGIPVFPEANLSIIENVDGYEISMDCRHTQTYP